MKAVAYCRYSTDNQTENSIAYQLNAIQKYCENHNFVMVNVYTDEAMSGTNTNREGLQRLLNDAEIGIYDAVIIYDQSRLSRNIVDWFTVRDALRENDIQLHSCTESLENNDIGGVGFLSEGVRALFNHQFVLDTRAKTIAGQTTKAKQGAFLGGKPPLGYDIKDGKYIINEFESKAVQMIFNQYAEGKGYGYIVDQLKRMGARSKRGAIIGENALYTILRNERYIGIYTWNKTREKYMRKWAGGKPNPNVVRIETGIIPPIIEMELWEKVQKIIGDRNQRAQNASGTAKQTYLLSSLIKCGLCGSAMVGFTTTSAKGYKTRYYSCGGKRRLHNCDCKNINADQIEAIALDLLDKKVLAPHVINGIADDIVAAYKRNHGDSTTIKNEIAECTRGIDNLLNAIEKGLDGELAFERIENLKRKKNALKTQLAGFHDAVPEKEYIIAILKQDIEAMKAASPDKLKAILGKYISKIVMTNDTIEIRCFPDLNGPMGGKKVTSPDISDDVTKTGCGRGI